MSAAYRPSRLDRAFSLDEVIAGQGKNWFTDAELGEVGV